MSKIRKQQTAWTLGTIAGIILILLAGVIAQSNYRTKQRNRILGEIYKDVRSQGTNQDKVAEAIVANKAKFEFIENHKPFINMSFKSVPADASLDPNTQYPTTSQELCKLLDEVYNDADWSNPKYGTDVALLKLGSDSLMAASGCYSDL